MNRLVSSSRIVLARGLSSSTRCGGGLPLKEQWYLDWNNDPVPGHHGRNWKSDNCGRKAGIWNYWAVAAIKYGWAGTLLAEVKDTGWRL